MEVIRLSGYINDEKVVIARRYLIPKSLERSGLKRGDVTYDRATLLAIAEGYAREAGLRNYEKALDRIHRKIARSVLLKEIKLPVSVDSKALAKYLGKALFNDEGIKGITRPGMALGLAWTPLGGAILIVESVANPGKEGFKLTGQLGNVMQESASIAYTWVRHIAGDFGVDKKFFEDNQIHLHVPAGATPKDGPSAGITMASSLLSLATDRKLKNRLAMTGELSLVGQVLPIGGLKEKVIAAKRNQVREIIIPNQNEKDLEEIPEHVKKGIVFHPVERMEQVVELIFNR
jgi:ATP-dependent Lon protease